MVSKSKTSGEVQAASLRPTYFPSASVADLQSSELADVRSFMLCMGVLHTPLSGLCWLAFFRLCVLFAVIPLLATIVARDVIVAASRVLVDFFLW
jgi:hypothetical protein